MVCTKGIKLITQEYIASVLDFDPILEVFTWKPRDESYFASRQSWKSWNAKFAGRQAGSINAAGYVVIALKGAPRRAHRLAWLYLYGRLPEGEIDHIDRNRSNNAIKNLREVELWQNSQNRSSSNDVPGVCWHKQNMKWVARIKINGRYISLGSFSRFDDAVSARKCAEDRFNRPPIGCK